MSSDETWNMTMPMLTPETPHAAIERLARVTQDQRAEIESLERELEALQLRIDTIEPK